MADFDPDAFIAQQQNVPRGTESDFNPDEFINEQKHGTPLEQLKTAGEGLAQGIAGPLATYAEKKLGVKSEDIVGRKEANPWTHGIAEAAGLTGSLATGTGEAGLIAKGAEHLVPEAASLAGKVGTGALKGFIENGLIQGGDEISNAMLGQGDPNAPVSAAMAHMGAAGLLGAGLGGAFAGAGAVLRSIGEAKGGTKAQKFLTDFEARTKFRQETPELASHVSDELKNFHQTTTAAADDVYGNNGLKDQAIKKLVPEVKTPAIEQQNQEIFNTLQDKLHEMHSDPESYPKRLTKKFDKLVSEWNETAAKPEATSHEIFAATQKLKQELQAHSKFDFQVGPLSQEKDFINVTKEVSHDLRTKLEDHKVWQQAAKLQQGVNKAFTEFKPALKDFEGKFGTKILGETNIDPDKIQTYINQVSREKGEASKIKLQNFVKAADAYRDQIDHLHNTLGLESPLESASLNATRGTFGERTPGAKFADYWHDKVPGGTNFIGARGMTAVGGLTGGLPGAAAGFALEKLAPHIEKHIGRPLNKYATAAALKAMSSGNAKRIFQALDYAHDVGRGAQKMKGAVKALFQGGAGAAIDEQSTDKNREKLKKFIESGKFNDEVAQLGNSDAPDAIAEHFPTQNVILTAAKSRINSYLNSIRPQELAPPLPFDEKIEDPEAEREYDHALDLANQPLSILNDVKDGSLTAESLKHFVGMYPELHDQLAKSIVENISKKQLAEENVPYHTKQGLSLFLGSPMDSSFTPQSIQAAQAVFAAQKSAKQAAVAQGAPKKTTNKLSKVAQNYRTGDQAVLARQQS